MSCYCCLVRALYAGRWFFVSEVIPKLSLVEGYVWVGAPGIVCVGLQRSLVRLGSAVVFV